MPKRAAKEGNRVVIRLSDAELAAVGALIDGASPEDLIREALAARRPQPHRLSAGYASLGDGRGYDDLIGVTNV